MPMASTVLHRCIADPMQLSFAHEKLSMCFTQPENSRLEPATHLLLLEVRLLIRRSSNGSLFYCSVEYILPKVEPMSHLYSHLTTAHKWAWLYRIVVKQVGFGAQGGNQRLETRNQKLDLTSDF